MKAQVFVRLKEGVLDPQGLAIQKSLKALGFDGVGKVKQGKVFDIEFDSADRSTVEKTLEDMSAKLLANTVIENFNIEIVED